MVLNIGHAERELRSYGGFRGNNLTWTRGPLFPEDGILRPRRSHLGRWYWDGKQIVLTSETGVIIVIPRERPPEEDPELMAVIHEICPGPQSEPYYPEGFAISTKQVEARRKDPHCGNSTPHINEDPSTLSFVTHGLGI